ncbi:hypothetical protein SAMN05216413_1598 [Ruminococcaceae bacterium KH2T8]|nr:hypothetical protein SAMN05216413_1598 [Ruminococcaceae bacterium KH2T8]
MFIVRSRTYGKGEAFRILPTKKKRVEALFFLFVLFGVFVVLLVVPWGTSAAAFAGELSLTGAQASSSLSV